MIVFYLVISIRPVFNTIYVPIVSFDRLHVVPFPNRFQTLFENHVDHGWCQGWVSAINVGMESFCCEIVDKICAVGKPWACSILRLSTTEHVHMQVKNFLQYLPQINTVIHKMRNIPIENNSESIYWTISFTYVSQKLHENSRRRKKCAKPLIHSLHSTRMQF